MSKQIYRGRLIDVSLDNITLPNRQPVELEIVRHPGGAVIVAVNEINEVCLLRQYRYAADRQIIWELPAGCIDASDPTPRVTAERELREEAGLSAGRWRELGSIYPSPGFCSERLFLYLAQDLEQGDTRHQSDELIEVHWVPFTRAMDMARSGQIQDAKTLVGLFLAQQAIP